ncbi:MAG: NAD-dependent epimerase/dehydratase family protein [Hahellaceae bacterium]|nr:NAD-dependent epimerase/dehydratase family protein [Hahellaceae bacterium]
MPGVAGSGQALVTGAAGFIGGRLVRRLLAEGRSVVALDVGACPADLMAASGLTWVSGDIRDSECLKSVVGPCGAVFHLAAVVGDWGAEDLHRSVTVDGTQSLLQVVNDLAHAAVVVLASSIVVYGAGSKPWVTDLAAELRKGTPALIGGGNYDAGLIHVDNVVDILIRASGSAGQAGAIYNAADEEGITWARYMADIAAACAAPVPRSIPRVVAQALAWALEPSYRALSVRHRPPITREALNLVGSAHRIDMQHTRRALGCQPVRHYRDGLREIQALLSR